MAKFKHSPIRSSHFRLLKIRPASNFDDVLHVRLFKIPFNRSYRYTALSYTWGAPFPGMSRDWDNPLLTETVFINECKFQVRMNLASALRHLRLNGHDSWFWIDAICIDQSNITERNEQVRRMKDLYERANETIIWLGPETDPKEQLLENVDNFITTLKLRYDSARKASRNHTEFSETRVNMFREYVDEYHNDLRAFGRLFQYNWFRRVWVIQEICMSRKALLMCGTRTMDWKTVFTLEEAFGHREIYEGDQSFLVIRLTSKPRKISAFQARHKNVSTFSQVFKMVTETKKFQATDARDKIYGLMGMAHENISLALNYGFDLHEVYGSFACNCIKEQRSYEVLGYCLLEPDKDFPSWIPDWRYPGKPFVHGRKFADGLSIYNASPDSSPIWNFFDKQYQKISIKGFIFDNVKVTLPGRLKVGDLAKTIPPRLDWDQDLIRRITSWHKRMESLISSKTAGRSTRPNANPHRIYNPTGEPLSQAIWETFLADNIPSPDRKGKFRVSEGKDFWRQYEGDRPPFLPHMIRELQRRRPFVSGQSLLGLGSRSAEDGDLIVIFLGGRVPYLLRPREDGTYLFVGECYVHGIMDGEAMHTLDNDDAKLQDFILC